MKWRYFATWILVSTFLFVSCDFLMPHRTDEEDSDVAVSIFDSCKTYNSYANTGYQERDHEDDRENGTYFRHGACSLAE